MLYIEFAPGYYISELGEVTTAQGKVITHRLHANHICVFVNSKYTRLDYLLAESFFEGFDKKKDRIVFKDGDKTNITVSNIKVVNRYRGKNKLSYEQCLKVKADYEKGIKPRFIYRPLGISKTTFFQILKTV